MHLSNGLKKAIIIYLKIDGVKCNMVLTYDAYSETIEEK